MELLSRAAKIGPSRHTPHLNGLRRWDMPALCTNARLLLPLQFAARLLLPLQFAVHVSGLSALLYTVWASNGPKLWRG